MKEFDFPEVTIVTVNFNGKRFLNNLFNSIADLNYPKSKIRTIMVDNASTDGSCQFVGKYFPWVKIISATRNLGYAGGNNAGFKAATGKYVALINNDCVVDKNWLYGLVKAAEFKKDIVKTGAISSKVLFYYNYMPVVIVSEDGNAEISDIKIESVPAPGNLPDIKPGGTVAVEWAHKIKIGPAGTKAEIKNSADKPGEFLTAGTSDILKSIKFLSGCSCKWKDSSTNNSSWQVSKYALIGFPLPNLDHDTVIRMKVKYTTKKNDLRFYIKKINEKNRGAAPEDICHYEDLCLITDAKIESWPNEIKVIISRDVYKYRNDIINSCGLELNKSFYARDRGGNSFDLGQYNGPDEVFGPSGSSFLVSREMLADVGFFNEFFFTYYEDVDLFWRARLRGWKVFYTPDSVARHHHCGTNVEWSYSFTYHVLRNRLLAIFRCGWLKICIKSYIDFLLACFRHTVFYSAALLKGKKQDRPDIKARLRIFFELFYIIPKQFVPRFKIRHKKNVADQEIKKMLIHF